MSGTAMFLPSLLHKMLAKPERKCSFMHNQHPLLVWVSELCIAEILCYRIDPHYSLSTLIFNINFKKSNCFFLFTTSTGQFKKNTDCAGSTVTGDRDCPGCCSLGEGVTKCDSVIHQHLCGG